jgi:hypothetical protein
MGKSVNCTYPVEATFGIGPLYALPETSTWDFLCFRPPGDCTALVILVGPPGVDFSNCQLTRDGGDDGGVAISYLRNYELGLFPSTTTLTLAGPPFLVPPSPPASYTSVLPIQGTNGGRVTAASFTLYFTGPTLYDGGNIVGGTFGRPIVRAGMRADVGLTNSLGVGPTTAVPYAPFTSSIPFVDAELLLLDPKSTSWPARQGIYCVTRHTGPCVPFAPTPTVDSAIQVQSLDVAGARQQNLMMPPGGNGAQWMTSAVWINLCRQNGAQFMPPQWMDNTNGSTYGSPSYEAYESFVGSLSIPVAIGRGLNYQATMTARCFTVVEFLPLFQSPIAQFSFVQLPPAPKLWELYHAIAHELRFIYPSAWNSMGTVLGAIANVASAVIPGVGAVVRALAPQPRARPAEELEDVADLEPGVTGSSAPPVSSLGPPPVSGSLRPIRVTANPRAVGLGIASQLQRLSRDMTPRRPRQRGRASSRRSTRTVSRSRSRPRVTIKETVRVRRPRRGRR